MPTPALEGKNTVADGNLSFVGGQNDGIPSHKISQEQYRIGVNVTTRGGVISPRPGWVHQKIKVLTSGGYGAKTYQQIFSSGKFQGAGSYDAEDGKYIIAIISGIIFRISKETKTAEVISLPDNDILNQQRRRIYWSHAGRFFVVFDYPNLPVIIEGKTARRVNPERESFPGVPLPEIPTSVMGSYVNNRLWVANELNSYIAGDPVNGINEDAPITFEEVLAAAAPYIGQVFSLGSQSANQPITAMGFLKVADSATGIGPLFVASKNSIYTSRADVPRKEWENIPFTRMISYNAGIAGNRSFVNVNSDLLYLSGEGHPRSLSIGAVEQDGWGNTSIGREVENFFKEYYNPELSNLSVVEQKNNRVFFTVAPYRVSVTDNYNARVADYAHAGLVVLELDNISALAQRARPVWAGLWTGISPMEMVPMEDGLYVFSKDDGGENNLYFLDENITYDVFDEEPKNIVCQIETKEYDFGSPFIDKELGLIDYSILNIEGDFSFKSEYKLQNQRKWLKWGELKHLAQIENPEALEGKIPVYASHNLPEINFGDPEETSPDTVSSTGGLIARKIALRLTISARKWELSELRLKFEALKESSRPNIQACDIIEEELLLGDSENNIWDIHRTATRDAPWTL